MKFWNYTCVNLTIVVKYDVFSCVYWIFVIGTQVINSRLKYTASLSSLRDSKVPSGNCKIGMVIYFNDYCRRYTTFPHMVSKGYPQWMAWHATLKLHGFLSRANEPVSLIMANSLFRLNVFDQETALLADWLANSVRALIAILFRAMIFGFRVFFSIISMLTRTRLFLKSYTSSHDKRSKSLIRWVCEKTQIFGS